MFGIVIKRSLRNRIFFLSKKFISIEEINLQKLEENKFLQTKECQELLESFFHFQPSSSSSSSSSFSVVSSPFSDTNLNSFETYLTLRGYNSLLSNNSNNNDKNSVSLRVLSMILTNPLTISYGIRSIFPHMKDIKILCLGARSESNLPLIWWKESIITLPSISNISIEMVGPEIIPQRIKESSSSIYSFQLPNSHQIQQIKVLSPIENKVFFHKLVNKYEKLLQNDLYLLFNPGYGANNIMKLQWKETLELLLHTKKPILCTSHSHGDLQRDLIYLNELVEQHNEEGLELGNPIEMIIQPQHNPFCSLSITHDPKEDQDSNIISTNSYIYAFKMK